MIRLAVILSILVVILTEGNAQKSNQQKSPRLSGSHTCIYHSKYSAEQRRQFYPFNISDTVKLISFRYQRNNYPLKGQTTALDSLIETVVLSKPDVDRLTDILYNNLYKQPPNYGVMTNCFIPRNAILFYDRQGKLKEHILLCFHCNEYRLSSDSVMWGDKCTKKMLLLKDFFVGLNLRFGTDNTIDRYPGENFGDEFVAPPKD